MTDNTEAVEKLAEIIGENVNFLYCDGIPDAAKAILAAIQADLIGYFPPKPLEFELVGTPPTYVSTSLDYGIQEGVEYGRTVWVLDERDEFLSEHPTLEAAQAAAYDDLCNRVKGLF